MFAPHPEQVRFADFVSVVFMRCPLPHVGCALHDVARCELEVWYWFAAQAGHVRCAVADAAYRVPLPQAGWLSQEVLRWELLVWNVFAPHPEHARFAVFESALIRLPGPQRGCAPHAVRRWLVEDWNVLAPHDTQLLPANVTPRSVLGPWVNPCGTRLEISNGGKGAVRQTQDPSTDAPRRYWPAPQYVSAHVIMPVVCAPLEALLAHLTVPVRAT